MKKIISKIIFWLSICGFLVLCIVLILEFKPNNTNNIDYVIEDHMYGDSNLMCADALEEIYKMNGYVYYLPCINSDNIYLVWTDGKETKMIDDLNSEKVTIDSLIKHGLKVYKEQE